MDPVIYVERLNHFLGEGKMRKQVLFDVSFQIFPGEIVILTGPSGSGKTTLLTLAGALRAPDEGRVRTLGIELSAAAPKSRISVRQQVGFIFQQHNLLEALSARQNVQLGLPPAWRATSREARQMSEEALAAVGLADRTDYLPGQLSGGQQLRVAIARALVRQPKVILADEPTAALDRKSGREIAELLNLLAKQRNCAILLVTHDNRILDIADRILVLEDGRLSSYTAKLVAETGQMMKTFADLQRRGELEHQIGALSDDQFVHLLDRTSAEFQVLLETLDLESRHATSALLDEILKSLATKVGRTAGADRATVYLFDRSRNMLRSKFAEHSGAEPFEVNLDSRRGIAGRAARTGQTQNVPDAYADPDFYPLLDQTSGYRTRSVLCLPVRDRNGEIFAVIQLLNKLNSETFTRQDEERLGESSRALGLVLEGLRNLTARHSRPPDGNTIGL